MSRPKYTPVPTRDRAADHTPRRKKPAEGDEGFVEVDDSESGPSACFLIGLNAFAFSYSLVVATLGVVILPSEAIHLFSEQHAMMLGVMLGCTGTTQLLGPAVGYHSDRSTSQYGRRRPLLVVGAVLACAGCVVMRVAREFMLSYLYIGALTAAIAGLNISYACYTALLPDLMPSAHLGRASGTMATMSMLGALFGFCLFGFLLHIQHAYTVYIVVIVMTVSLTCCVAKEKAKEEAAPFSVSELVSAYSIDVVAHTDFFWVFVTRVFYYMGISLQAFLLFMLRDVQHVKDAKRTTALLAMINQLSAALIAAPSGWLSDRYGRKPLVYASCLVMASVYLGFALAPSLDVIIWMSVAFGLGNGMFLSVDYALACDTMPSAESAAQGLGVWGVSAFLGSTLGPLIAAPLLAYFGWTSDPNAYSTQGYTAVNLAGTVYVCLSGLFLCCVRAR